MYSVILTHTSIIITGNEHSQKNKKSLPLIPLPVNNDTTIPNDLKLIDLKTKIWL